MGFRCFWWWFPVCCTILVACADKKVSSWCPEPVKAEQEVKDWFTARTPLPPKVNAYLDRVGRQQKTIEENCP